MKKSLSVFLSSIILIFSISTTCFADIPDTAPNIPDGYRNFKEYLWQIVQDVGYIGLLPAQGLTDIVNTILRNNGQSDVAEDITTDNQAANWLINNGISIDGNGNTVLTGNSLQFVKNLIDYEISDSGYIYSYAFDLQYSFNNFPNGNLYNAFRRFIVDVHENMGDDYICILFNWQNAYDAYYLKLDDTNYIQLATNGLYTDYARVTFMGDNTGFWYAPNASYFGRSHFNGTDFIPDTSFTYPYYVHNNLRDVTRFALSQNSIGVTTHNEPCVYAFDTNQVFIVYLRGSDFINRPYDKTQADYYINSPIYNNFKKSTGDYTVTTDNSNHVSYGDVINYVTENPNVSLPDIQIYIDNNIPGVAPDPTPTPTPTPTPNPDNPSGGGSVSVTNNNDPTINNNPNITNNPTFNNNPNINISLLPNVSGNGFNGGSVSGNGSGNGGFFDWISDIGDVIGNFIKNVGELIADVVRGISETITTIMSTIPNLLSSIVEFVYGGLPEELKALVTLGITAVVLVSVIKILRK